MTHHDPGSTRRPIPSTANADVSTRSSTSAPSVLTVDPKGHKRPKRTRWLKALYAACVILPPATVGSYEYGVASDQYVSSFEFVVRQQVPASAGHGSFLASLGGGNPMLAIVEDSEIVKKYILSHQILQDLKSKVSLQQIFATTRADWLSRLSKRPTDAQTLRYWRRMVDPYFDMSSGVIRVKVKAFSPASAHTLAVAILTAAEDVVNQMSEKARHSSLASAEAAAAAAQLALNHDEEALAAFRNAHGLLSPQMSAGRSSGVVSRLQIRLATDQAQRSALIAGRQTKASPQVQTLDRTIASLKHEIFVLKSTLADPSQTLQDDTMAQPRRSLATVMAGYDSLKIHAKLDEQQYGSALTSLQEARQDAVQRQIYLETFVEPNTPDSSTAPNRLSLTGEAGLAGCLLAFILAMIIANIAEGRHRHL